MKIFKFYLIFATAGLFITACAENKPVNSTTANAAKPAVNAPATVQPTAAPDELAAAKRHFSEKCVQCHKENGTGGVTNFEGVKIEAPDLTTEKFKKEPDTEFVEAIEKGFPDDGMPAFKGKLSDQEIKDLVKLIRRDIQKK